MRYRFALIISVTVVVTSIFCAAAWAGDVKLPKINRKTLDNGLKVLVIEHHEQPIVSLRLAIVGGRSFDTTEKAGLASLTAGLLRKGTTMRNAEQISDEIDFVGGSLGAAAGLDATYVVCWTLTKHLETGVDLLADIVINPAFTDDEIERLRNQTIANIIRSKDDPSSVAANIYNKTIFGNHPYGLPSSGTEKTVSMITRDDVTAFHKKYYIPNNSFLIVVGDVKPKDIFKLVEQKFGSWEKGAVSEMKFPDPPKIKGYKIILIDKPDATQSNIKFGHLGINRTNPDIFAVRVMNYILGGSGFASRLMKNIRAEQGLTYDIRSWFSLNRDVGDFTVTTFTKNESSADAINSTIRLLKEIQTDGVTEDEINECHSFYSGYFPLVFETPAQIGQQVQIAELYHLGDKYLTNFISYINSVDSVKASDAAKKYLDPDNMIFVVVGKADDIKADLEKIGPVTIYKLSEL